MTTEAGLGYVKISWTKFYRHRISPEILALFSFQLRLDQRTPICRNNLADCFFLEFGFESLIAHDFVPCAGVPRIQWAL